MFRSSPPEVVPKKDALQIQSKLTGEQPRRSAISTKPLCNFIEITPRHKCATRIQSRPSEHLFLGELLWETIPVCQKSFERDKL